jgi:hypothetical protein
MEHMWNTFVESPIPCEQYASSQLTSAGSRSVQAWSLPSSSSSSMVGCQFPLQLTPVVNPDRIPGKVTVIGRYGADKVGPRWSTLIPGDRFPSRSY